MEEDRDLSAATQFLGIRNPSIPPPSSNDDHDMVRTPKECAKSKSHRSIESIVEAIEYLHQNQVVHLDVKPENIMISDRNRAKLIDFGWAIDLKKNGPLISGPMGSLSYAAPEIYRKAPFRGPPADIFSLGVTLVVGVTGQRCWDQADPAVDVNYADWVNRTNLHSNAALRRLPPDLINFLTRLLAHKPRERLLTDQIKDHPWFRLGLTNQLTPVADPIPASSTAMTSSSSTSSFKVVAEAPPSDLPMSIACKRPRNLSPIDKSTGVVYTGRQVPMSQPIPTSILPDEDSNDSSLFHEVTCLSQPADLSTMMLEAKEAIYKSPPISPCMTTVVPKTTEVVNNLSADVASLGFACIMRRMTRFFSRLDANATQAALKSAIQQLRRVRCTRSGSDSMLVSALGEIQIRPSRIHKAVFRILLYPLAGSILVDCRRVSGDGFLFHQTFKSIYTDLKQANVVNESHPYLQLVTRGLTVPGIESDFGKENVAQGQKEDASVKVV